MANQISDKLQGQLDKAALKEVLNEKKVEQAGAPPPVNEIPVDIAPKATILDELVTYY